MKKEAFLKMNIEEQVQLINKRTVTGLKVSDVAGELGMGDNALRNILKRNNYIYSRVNKGYLLNEISIEISKKESKENSKAIKIRQVKGALFSNEEIKGLKELLAIKESLLKIETTTRNNQTITVMDISNIDKRNRKKATFNMGMELLYELGKYEKELINISKSDIVNQALKDFLERNKSYYIKE